MVLEPMVWVASVKLIAVLAAGLTSLRLSRRVLRSPTVGRELLAVAGLNPEQVKYGLRNGASAELRNLIYSSSGCSTMAGPSTREGRSHG